MILVVLWCFVEPLGERFLVRVVNLEDERCMHVLY